MVNDSVANLITKLKNAGMARKDSVIIPESKLSASILAVLEKEGFIGSFTSKLKEGRGIEVKIAYDEEGNPKISEARRISKLSKRSYIGAKDIKPVRSGYGVMIISTPKGILCDRDAKKQNVGGEALFKIW